MTGRKGFVLFGIGGIALIVAFLTFNSLGDSVTYYLYPTEAEARRAEFPDGERFRLAGVVVPGSLDTSADPIVFSVSDGGATIDVNLTGTPPDLFAEDVPVLIEGAWQGDIFSGDEVLIRHDENYEAPDTGGPVENA